MNERINQLAIQAGGIWQGGFVDQKNGSSVYEQKKFVDGADMDVEQFAKLIIEETLKQVDERTYGRGENQWYYEQDKDWVRLHFGYGNLSKWRVDK